MNKKLLALAALGLLVGEAHAFTPNTHARFVRDAVAYMQRHPDTTNYAQLAAAANRAGYSIEAFGAAIGQGAADVDSFIDTYMCGNATGICVHSPLDINFPRYTAYWHFEDHRNGPDAHGNEFGGYNYARLGSFAGTVDDMAATLLWNDYLDDGAGGMTGWFGLDATRYNSYGVTEARYRQGSSSSKEMYRKFQTAPFQPISNLAQYWYNEFWQRPTAQTLGFALHSTDLLQPHHTWGTSSYNHPLWELWVEFNYDLKSLNDDAQVTAALQDFQSLNPASSEIRPLLKRGGAFSYSVGGAVVKDAVSEQERILVARQVVPHAIAMVVRVLNHAATRF